MRTKIEKHEILATLLEGAGNLFSNSKVQSNNFIFYGGNKGPGNKCAKLDKSLAGREAGENH